VQRSSFNCLSNFEFFRNPFRQFRAFQEIKLSQLPELPARNDLAFLNIRPPEKRLFNTAFLRIDHIIRGRCQIGLNPCCSETGFYRFNFIEYILSGIVILVGLWASFARSYAARSCRQDCMASARIQGVSWIGTDLSE